MTPKSCGEGCPIVTLVSFISKKWMLFIIRAIADGASCYSEMEKELQNINPSILSSRLKELQDFGFVEKKIVSESPVKIEYKLTKKGKSFSQQIENIVNWSVEWM
ncbi:helix-turn-helix transcriptional regulator [Candidatus Gracilibacteria bacterium 28_42_T64]|nr:helix-turn-helix transcriptional regulator [Candidatus Gracilibacteria bacterium 28_42_T64]